MKSIAVALLLVASLAGCAVVPIGPPVYVGGSVNYGYGNHHGGGYGPYYRGGGYGPYYRGWR